MLRSFVAALLALAAAPLPAGLQQPTFRVTANYIEIDANVTDARGAFVRDLTPDDFEIVEDGKAQTVTVMSIVDLPFERPDRPLYRPTAVEPDVISNATADAGRVYVIVFDGYHIAPQRSSETRQQARQFIERYVGANDLAAVVHVGAPLLSQEFTSNKRLLLASVERFLGQKGRSAAAAINADALGLQDLRSAGFDPGSPVDTDEPLRAYVAREAMRAIKQVAEQLGTVTGRRKAMLLFSEGIDYDTMDGPTEIVNRRAVVRDAGEVLNAERQMIASATRANVSIYSVDPRGLVSGMEEAITLGALPAGGSLPIAQMAADLRRGQDTLRMFSAETGGRSAIDSNDLSHAFERLMRDSSTYYMLGYNSTTAKDGRFHKVSVKVKRPGVEVRARQGYYASLAAGKNGAPPPPPDPVSRLLNAATPSGGLGLRVNAGVVRVDDPRAGKSTRGAVVHITVEVSGADIAFEPRAPLFFNDIELAWQAFDDRGTRRVNERKVINLKLLQANRDLVAARGLRHVVELPLPPGRYQLRIAAHERVNSRAGSVFYDLDVPDVTRDPVTLSSLLLTSQSAVNMFTTGEAPAIGQQMPGPITAARTFARDDILAAGATILVNDTSRAYTIDITTSVRADDGTVVFRTEDSRSSAEVGRLGYLSVTAIPLEKLAAGSYVVAIEARSRLGGGAAIVRETSIAVR